MTFNLWSTSCLTFCFPFIRQIKFQCLKLKVLYKHLLFKEQIKLWDKSNGNKRKLKREKKLTWNRKKKECQSDGNIIIIVGRAYKRCRTDRVGWRKKSTKCFFRLPAFFSVLVCFSRTLFQFLLHIPIGSCVLLSIYTVSIE